jgi:mono/diheme cytochrome c family protein
MIAILGLLLCAGFGVRGFAQTSGAECNKFHKSEAASQPATLMAHALELPRSNPNFAAHPLLSYKLDKFTYTIKTSGHESTYSVSDGAETLTLPIAWSFGAEMQTWVLSQNGKFYESRVSYYPAIKGLDITPGDAIKAPRDLVEAMGRELPAQETKSCFGCHATGAVINDKLNLAALKPGVGCEHCHEGATIHAADAVKHNYNSAPASLSALSAENMSKFCGQCHRSFLTVASQRLLGPTDIRFAPFRLALSKCFDGTDARIRCTSCHDPHVDLNREIASYDPKCLACHAPSKKNAGGAVHPEAKVCTVAKFNCAACHMPREPRVDGHVTFTDHFIRVVKTGESYPD